MLSIAIPVPTSVIHVIGDCVVCCRWAVAGMAPIELKLNSSRPDGDRWSFYCPVSLCIWYAITFAAKTIEFIFSVCCSVLYGLLFDVNASQFFRSRKNKCQTREMIRLTFAHRTDFGLEWVGRFIFRETIHNNSRRLVGCFGVRIPFTWKRKTSEAKTCRQFRTQCTRMKRRIADGRVNYGEMNNREESNSLQSLVWIFACLFFLSRSAISTVCICAQCSGTRERTFAGNICRQNVKNEMRAFRTFDF